MLILGPILLVIIVVILFVIFITVEALVRVLSFESLASFGHPLLPGFFFLLFAGTLEVVLKIEYVVVILLLLHFVVLQLLSVLFVVRVF